VLAPLLQVLQMGTEHMKVGQVPTRSRDKTNIVIN
jgi:hypothetical protein